MRDEVLIPHIKRAWNDNLKVYGADKVWKQMNREAIPVPAVPVQPAVFS